MNPEKTYRTSVIPLSAFLVLCGVILAPFAWVVPAPITSPFPFIESEALNRHLFGIAGLTCVGIGVGLFYRNRFAWYALLAYLTVGTLLPAISALDARTVALRGFAFPILGTLLNGTIGVGIYFVVRPAFGQERGKAASPKSSA